MYKYFFEMQKRRPRMGRGQGGPVRPSQKPARRVSRGLFADLHDLTAAADAVGVNSELGPRPHKVLS